MPFFSPKSEERLSTCHPDLQTVCRELIKQYDFSVLCGHRNKAEQDAAFAAGNSRLKYPQSKHKTQQQAFFGGGHCPVPDRLEQFGPLSGNALPL